MSKFITVAHPYTKEAIIIKRDDFLYATALMPRESIGVRFILTVYYEQAHTVFYFIKPEDGRAVFDQLCSDVLAGENA